ncbi:MAG TPA: phospholipase D-like domain-containing protein [Nitrospira sp.]|nr:phospholipase D-like domain-containing protein [Nitrospira sp.]
MNSRPAFGLNANRYALAGCLLWILYGTSVGQAGGATIEIYFAPEEAPLDRVVALYERARRYIFVSVYGFTSSRAVEALVAAKKRGLDVRLITDQGRTLDVKQRSALHTLRLAGIPVRVNRHDGLMHLKQVVIDDDVNTSGSMNHTTSGNRYNDERLDIVTDHAATVKAREKFLAMWNDRERFEPWVKE